VNCDSKNPDTNSLASKYGVVYVPTLIFIDSKGKVVSKLVGTIDLDKLKENVEKTLN
jgi:thioredoxin-related protein